MLTKKIRENKNRKVLYTYQNYEKPQKSQLKDLKDSEKGWIQQVWGGNYEYFIKDADLNINCDLCSGLFFFMFSGLPYWSELHNNITRDYFDFREDEKTLISNSHAENVSYECFSDFMRFFLSKNEKFKEFTEQYILYISGNIDKQKNDGEEKSFQEPLDIEKNHRHVLEYLNLFNEEEFKLQTDLISLLIIYLCRYHVTIKGPIKKSWLSQSINHMQFFESTETKLDSYFKENTEINMKLLKFLGFCTYQSIKEYSKNRK